MKNLSLQSVLFIQDFRKRISVKSLPFETEGALQKIYNEISTLFYELRKKLNAETGLIFDTKRKFVNEEQGVHMQITLYPMSGASRELIDLKFDLYLDRPSCLSIRINENLKLLDPSIFSALKSLEESKAFKRYFHAKNVNNDYQFELPFKQLSSRNLGDYIFHIFKLCSPLFIQINNYFEAQRKAA